MVHSVEERVCQARFHIPPRIHKPYLNTQHIIKTPQYIVANQEIRQPRFTTPSGVIKIGFCHLSRPMGNSLASKHSHQDTSLHRSTRQYINCQVWCSPNFVMVVFWEIIGRILIYLFVGGRICSRGWLKNWVYLLGWLPANPNQTPKSTSPVALHTAHRCRVVLSSTHGLGDISLVKTVWHAYLKLGNRKPFPKVTLPFCTGYKHSLGYEHCLAFTPLDKFRHATPPILQ